MNNAYHDTPPLNNHKKSFEDGLNAGYRGLNFDLCSCDSGLAFCHGDCELGMKSVLEVFNNINTFLDKNPSEIIIINIEKSVNDPTPQELWTLIGNITRIEEKVYEHNQIKSWPTMKKMVDDGIQLIIFMDNRGGCSGKDGSTKKGCTPKILELFDYTVSTNSSFESIKEIEDVDNSCPANHVIESTKDFYSVNNFVTRTEGNIGPSASAAKTLNCLDFLKQRTKECQQETGLKINMLQVDFWHIGDLPEFVQVENKARADRRSKFVQVETTAKVTSSHRISKPED